MKTQTSSRGALRASHHVRRLGLALVALSASTAHGQTTAFTYQGQLSDAGTPANDSYDVRFALFDSATGGAQIGANQTVPAVPVSAGVFTVQLDFGVNAFPGANRFVEIAVRPAGGGSFTMLAPRQQISSSPYAIRTLSAATADALSGACVGCVTNTHIQSVAGSKVSGAIPLASLPAGSGSYIQNTTTQQANTNLNVSGDATVGGTLSSSIVSATTQYDLGGAPVNGFGSARVLSAAGDHNLFVGLGAGKANTSGERNTFVGASAGLENTDGERNAFVGAFAGEANTTGNGNAFVGFAAGQANTTGDNNAFVGLGAGLANTTGNRNAFFGAAAGLANTSGEGNVFVGAATGQANTTGLGNTFVGAVAGEANTTGFGNAFVGGSAGEANTTGGLNAFVGGAAGQANTTGNGNTFVGAYAGLANTTGERNAFVGGGAGGANTTGEGNAFVGGSAGGENATGNRNTIVGANADVGANNLTNATAIGADAQVGQSDALVLGSVAGINGAASSVNVGIGTTTPKARLHVDGGAVVTTGNGREVSLGSPNGESGIGIRGTTNQGTTNRADVRFDGATLKLVTGPNTGPPASTSGIAINMAGSVGIGTLNPLAKLDVAGTLKFDTPGGGASEQLCRNSVSHTIGICGSSLRYKQQIAPYRAGLDLISRLQPISFSWKGDGRRDLGLGAEDVATVEPLLVTHNDQGEIEGVKYDHLNVVLINAIKQQQGQIEALQAANVALNARLHAVENGMGHHTSGVNDFVRSN